MAATDTTALLSGTECIFGCISGTELKLAVIIKLLATAAGVPTDTDSLLAGTECIQSCIVGSDLKLAVIISLLNQIAGGGGGIPAAASIICGTGVPLLIPKSGCGAYIQTDSVPPGQLWLYYSGAWH